MKLKTAREFCKDFMVAWIENTFGKLRPSFNAQDHADITDDPPETLARVRDVEDIYQIHIDGDSFYVCYRIPGPRYVWDAVQSGSANAQKMSICATKQYIRD